MSETIYALASAPGRAGIAVIRVSGPEALASFKALTGKDAPAPRHAIYVALCHPVSCETLDHGVATYFQAPASYTGEDVLEYAVHGGKAVVDGVLTALSACENHRLAQPGEFTRRAFENGKLDLTEAEAVADLIDAETALQRDQALSQLGGSLSGLYADWAARLTKAMAHMEADLDFPDEGDVEDGLSAALKPEIETLITEIAAHLDDNNRGERLRDGIRIAVIGAPNAGKSSLVNALARREAAIVSPHAGTTRDVIEVHLNIGGYPVILSDTAGLRPEDIGQEGQDSIEQEGIRRALKVAQEADIKLLVFDGTEIAPHPATLALKDDNAIVVMNKSDVQRAAEKDAITVSATTGENLEVLTTAIQSLCAQKFDTKGAPSLTRARHRDALTEACAALTRSLTAAMPELAAEDIRLALRAIGRITGRVDVEDLLDIIFKDFCIGK